MRAFEITCNSNACGPSNLSVSLLGYYFQLGIVPRYWYGGKPTRWFGLGIWKGVDPLYLTSY